MPTCGPRGLIKDNGHDPWGDYGAFEDDNHLCVGFDDKCFRDDLRRSLLLVVFARLL